MSLSVSIYVGVFLFAHLEFRFLDIFLRFLRRREKNWLGECPCNEADDTEEFDKEAAQAGKPVEQRM